MAQRLREHTALAEDLSSEKGREGRGGGRGNRLIRKINGKNVTYILLKR